MDPFLDPQNLHNQQLQEFANRDKANAPASVATPQTPVLESTPEQQALNEQQAQARRFGVPFNVKVPTAIPSDAINNDVTTEDVFARRNELEAQQVADQQFDKDLTSLNERVATPTPTPFVNPEEFINSLILNQPTATQTSLDRGRAERSKQLRGFAGEYERTGKEARKQFALPELEANLAETNKRIAERTVRLREQLRDFETNAIERGVERRFVDAEKQKIQADAARELADLSIIQSAQQGNVQAAQAGVDRLLDQKKQAFEFENAAIESEIERLEAINTREADVRSEQLQIALTERKRQEDKLIADEEQRLNYLSEAAANGADTGTLEAIRNAKTPGEAALLAGPFIGKLDRALKYQQIRSAQATADAKEYEITLMKDAEKQRKEAIESGALTTDQAETIDSIDKEFRSEPIVKDYNTAVAKRFAVEEVLANGVKGVGDLLVVYEFMKSVDPTSVVRESEFDNAAKTGNIFAGAYTKFNQGYFGEGGFLPDDVKESFVSAMNASYKGKQVQYFNVRDNFGEKVNRRIGVDTGSDYLTAYEDGAPASYTATQDPERAEVGEIVQYGDVRYRKLQDGSFIEI